MAKFLDIPRRTGGYRPERLGDYDEVEEHLCLDEISAQAARCMGCGIPFCHGAGCPLGNDIQDFNACVAEKRFADAYFVLSKTSPFPEFTSRVCPALCEAAWCAGLSAGAVTVRQIEYAVIEYAFSRDIVCAHPPRIRTGKRVAVIGSGPAGLALADALNMLGHEVVVFEKNVNFGGLLRYGIPDFKLSKRVIDRRLSVMRDSGVMFEGDVRVGVDVSAEYLRKKFDAVCLCTGSQIPRALAQNVKGRDSAGVCYALDFLGSQARFNSGESQTLKISARGRNVLVVGGGDTGSDCLGTALRQGAKSVVQVEITPKPPLSRHSSTPWPQWPYMLRTSSSQLEGGERMWSVNLKEIENRARKRQCAVFSKLDWTFDQSGRPKSFTEIKGSEFKIEADLIILSMGFSGAGERQLMEQLGVPLNARGFVDSSCVGRMGGVFACGDCASGPSLVVRAIASARITANAVDKYLGNKLT